MYCDQRSQYIRINSKKNSFRGNYSRKYGIYPTVNMYAAKIKAGNTLRSRLKTGTLVKPKPSLKIKTASAIFWNYLGIFRDYGLF